MFQELFLGFHVCHLIPQQSQEEGSVNFLHFTDATADERHRVVK